MMSLRPVTSVLIACAALPVPSWAGEVATSSTTPALQLGAGNAGTLQSWSGGQQMAAATPVTAAIYSPIKVTHRIGMSAACWNWIASSVNGAPSSMDGALLSINATTSAPLSGLQFTKGVVSELDFPALDTASKSDVLFTTTLGFAALKTIPVSGQAPLQPLAQKVLTGSSFRVAIDGLSTVQVSRVEPITIAGRKVSPLVLTMPTSAAASFDAWLSAARSGTATPKGGSLTILSPTFTPYLTLTFSGLTISESATLSGSSPSLTRVTMAVGSAQLQPTVGP